MDQLSGKRIAQCKIKIENDLINFESKSYIKEEIMISDMTEYSDNKVTSAASSALQADEIAFGKLNKDESKLTHQICNQDDTNSDNYLTNIKSEAYIKEEIMVLDITEHFDDEASYSATSSHHTDEIAFERMNKDEIKLTHKQQVCNKDITNSDKFNTAILVCPTCVRKDKIVNARRRPNCCNCKKPMNYECLTCGKQKKSEIAIFHHIAKCGRMTQCTQCSYKGKNERLLRLHVRRQHSVKQECPNCNRKFTKHSIRQHMEGCGISVQYLRCTFCLFDTKYKANMFKHVQKAHTNIKSSQFAGIIKKIIEEGEKIKANALNSAYGSKVDILSRTPKCKNFIQLFCMQCNEIRKNADYRNKRVCEKCGVAALLECGKCAKRYSKIKTMYAHLSHKCAARKCFQCAHCDYASTSKKNLEIHIRRKHMVMAPEDYKWCSKCNRRYKNQFNLNKHERDCGNELLQRQLSAIKYKDKACFDKHPNVDNAVIPAPADDARIEISPKPMNRKEEMKVMNLTKMFCLNCDKTAEYVKHSPSKCNKCGSQLMYSCNECAKIYSHFYYLRNHVIHNHLSEKLKKRLKYCFKQLNMQCAHCHFSTKHRTSIIVHLRKMHGEAVGEPKRLICTQCGKRYISKSNLQRHHKYYCGKQRSFACNHCNYQSSKKFLLINHLKSSHKCLFAD